MHARVEPPLRKPITIDHLSLGGHREVSGQPNTDVCHCPTRAALTIEALLAKFI